MAMLSAQEPTMLMDLNVNVWMDLLETVSSVKVGHLGCQNLSVSCLNEI